MIHPLMGPIFTSRTAAAITGEHCSMCIGDSPAMVETTIRNSIGRDRHVCLPHDLLLHRAFDADSSGCTGFDDYEAYVLQGILYDSSRPGWMPVSIYTALTRRAKRKAHLLAITIMLPKVRPLLDARLARSETVAADIRHSTNTPTD